MNLSSLTPSGRQLVILDRNRELWIARISSLGVKAFGGIGTTPWKKLGTNLESFIWNEEGDLLAGLVDGKFVCWYYPLVVFVDEDILNETKFEKDAR